jgi:hypothetical protein
MDGPLMQTSVFLEELQELWRSQAGSWLLNGDFNMI